MSAVIKTLAPAKDPVLSCVPDWSIWPLAKAMRLRIIVARDAQAQWCALTPDIDDVLLHEAVARSVPHPLAWRHVDEETLSLLLAQGEQSFEARGALLSGEADATSSEGASALHLLTVDTISRQSSPVIKLLDATLFDALKAQASDLHMESTASGMVIRHRLDGVMRHVGDVGSREVAEQLVSRLKVMAELDIGERRLPQDGRFKLRVLQSVEEGLQCFFDEVQGVNEHMTAFLEGVTLLLLERALGDIPWNSGVEDSVTTEFIFRDVHIPHFCKPSEA